MAELRVHRFFGVVAIAACHLPQKSLDFTFSGQKIFDAAKR